MSDVAAKIDRCETRVCVTSAVSIELTLGRVTQDSLPPCGGGMGWGVVQYRTAVPYFPTPTPIPSPQGGGEEFAALANRNLSVDADKPGRDRRRGGPI
jgi:hypothetical protein